MPMRIDSLLVALLVVVGLEPEPNASGQSAVTTPDRQVQAPREDRASAEPPSVCRAYADPEARHKCTVRIGRLAASGAAEPRATYPETLIWLAPAEPPMPFKLQPNTLR
jgi:hypothetical protein